MWTAIAKVTGTAKYAAEYNVPDLLHASVVGATIAKGRIIRIDDAAALEVEGVFSVLTHENRPPMADDDQAWKDDIAPDGSPFRPLFDDRIMFKRSADRAGRRRKPRRPPATPLRW